MRTFLSEFNSRLRGMFNDDESGAESSEVILVLVLLVVGLIAAWGYLREKLAGKAKGTGDCIDNAGSATGSSTC